MTNPHKPTTRRGTLLFEITGSTVLLGVVLVLIARMAVAINTQSRLAEQRELASRTLQNTMEAFAVLDPAERLKRSGVLLPVADDIVLRLASAEMTAEVAADNAEGLSNAQRVTLRLAWQPSPGADATSLALTTFFYPNQEPPQ